jgi:biotin transport system substrate-specific component
MKYLVGSHKVIVARNILFISVFSFLMVLSSQIKIPLFFTPVPLTFQTLVLFLSIVSLRERAILSQAIYIFLGLVGVPVFSKGAGLLYLFGPTGGYLLGFLVVALIFPYFLEFTKGGRHLDIKFFFLFLGANLVIYLFGAGWLKIVTKVSVKNAILMGIVPFIGGDLLKILLASVLSCRIVKYSSY